MSSKLIARVVGAAIAAATLSIILTGCGGGSEVTAPVPIVASTGMGQITLDGLDLGSTELVSALVAESVGFDDSAVEPVDASDPNDCLVFSGGPPPFIDLANGNLIGAPTLTDCDDGTVYMFNTSWFFNDLTGRITDNDTDPAIVDGTRVQVAYNFQRTEFGVSVGMTVPTGDRVEIDVFNIPEQRDPSEGPIGMTADSAPADDFEAFNVTLDRRLSESPVLRAAYILDRSCDGVPGPPGAGCLGVSNEMTLSRVDLKNRLNPCIEGRLTAVVFDQIAQPPQPRQVLEVIFDDPDCPAP